MIAFPDKKYRVIYADPPWRYQNNRCQGAAEQQYPTMPLKDICSLPVHRLAEKDSVLFMWATYPMLSEALSVINSWGFTYKTIGFQWIKLNKNGSGYFFGTGHWTRSNSEVCLLAVKGRPKRKSARVSQLVISPIGRHSKKPPEVRDKIVELMGEDVTRIELFAREVTAGWDCWGNEVGPAIGLDATEERSPA